MEQATQVERKDNPAIKAESQPEKSRRDWIAVGMSLSSLAISAVTSVILLGTT